jgi:hypothetical protein
MPAVSGSTAPGRVYPRSRAPVRCTVAGVRRELRRRDGWERRTDWATITARLINRSFEWGSAWAGKGGPFACGVVFRDCGDRRCRNTGTAVQYDHQLPQQPQRRTYASRTDELASAGHAPQTGQKPRSHRSTSVSVAQRGGLPQHRLERELELRERGRIRPPTVAARACFGVAVQRFIEGRPTSSSVVASRSAVRWPAEPATLVSLRLRASRRTSAATSSVSQVSAPSPSSGRPAAMASAAASADKSSAISGAGLAASVARRSSWNAAIGPRPGASLASSRQRARASSNSSWVGTV